MSWQSGFESLHSLYFATYNFGTVDFWATCDIGNAQILATHKFELLLFHFDKLHWIRVSSHLCLFFYQKQIIKQKMLFAVLLVWNLCTTRHLWISWVFIWICKCKNGREPYCWGRSLDAGSWIPPPSLCHQTPTSGGLLKHNKSVFSYNYSLRWNSMKRPFQLLSLVDPWKTISHYYWILWGVNIDQLN